MRPAILLCLAAQCCAAQTGGYVMNAIGSASSQPNVLAPGMLASATETASLLDLFNQPGPSPHSASVSVRQIGASAAILAAVVRALPGTVNFIVPLVPYGPAQLAWQIDDGPWRWTNVTIASTNFELVRMGGAGPVLAIGPSTRVGLATPAQPGQTITLSGSGLGIGTDVHVTLGGMPATVLFAGRGATAGYDVIRIRVPEGIADSCYAPLALTAGASSASSTMSVTSDGSPCRHPFNLSIDDMKTLDGGGALAVGEIDMTTTLQAVLPSAASRQEYLSVGVGERTATDLARYFTPSAAATGSCTAASQAAIGAVRSGVFLNAPVPAPPSLGDSLTLQSPAMTFNLTGTGDGGTYFSARLPPPQDGTVADPPRPAIAGGRWTWNSPGSADLAPSSFVFALPAPLQLNGDAPLSVRRAQDQPIHWNGDGFDPSATVTIFLNGHAGGAATGRISCTAPAQAGTIAIPAALLSTFAPASIATLNARVNYTGASMPHMLFRTRSGAALLMIVSYTASDNRQVDFQ
jgi:uncharacterized protein (TIGR03437 family)